MLVKRKASCYSSSDYDDDSQLDEVEYERNDYDPFTRG